MPMLVRDGSLHRVFLGPVDAFNNQLLMTPPGQALTMAQVPQNALPPLPAQPPVAQVITITSGSATSSSRASSPQNDGEKIPRPANAWIMYRKHHHASFVAANPGVHNNQICKYLFSCPRLIKLTHSSGLDFHQVAFGGTSC
jgi:hypothetical protein